MIAKIETIQGVSMLGISPFLVQVEVSIRKGLPKFLIIGLPATTVKEATDRIRMAIENSGFHFPLQTILVNLSPVEIRKEGAYIDLPIALAILSATKQISNPTIKLKNLIAVGELGLDGMIKPASGLINILIEFHKWKFSKIIIPEINKKDTRLFDQYEFSFLSHLSELKEKSWGKFIKNEEIHFPEFEPKKQKLGKIKIFKEQMIGLRAIEIALSGWHHVLFLGSPGTGKTMLSKLAKSLFPISNFHEFLEILRIKSFSYNQNFEEFNRPFRNPHHTSSDVALVGGGKDLKIGEITKAHGGILFLDEMAEFKPSVIQALREPLEEGKITISRANGNAIYPARFILIGASNPCPCGYYQDLKKKCICTPYRIKNYILKLSGPFLDRIDLFTQLNHFQLRESNVVEIDLDEIQERIQSAHMIQKNRYQNQFLYNGILNNLQIEKFIPISQELEELLLNVQEKNLISIRKKNSIMKIARTIADLHGSSDIAEGHVYEAINYSEELTDYFDQL